MKTLLSNTVLLQCEMVEFWNDLVPMKEKRVKAPYYLAELSLNNYFAATQHFVDGHYGAAMHAIRHQFSFLVKSVWVLFSPQHFPIGMVSRFEDLAVTAEMIQDLRCNAACPDTILKQIISFEQSNWETINSLAWMNLPHALSTIIAVIRNSNAIAALTLQLLTSLSSEFRKIGPVSHMLRKHEECFPALG